MFSRSALGRDGRMSSGVFLGAFIISVAAVGGSNGENCQTPDGQLGQCIQLQNCPALVATLQKRPIPQNVQTYIRNLRCDQGRNPKICCATSQPGFDDGLTNSQIPTTEECGYSPTTKILGGHIVQLDDFPWTALLEYTTQHGKSFLCGGVLVAARYVLTAAHCVNGPAITPGVSLTGVRLGEWDISSARDCVQGLCSDPPLDISVESTAVHEGYDPRSTARQNDIALVRLARPVNYTSWVQPICLPLIRQRNNTQQSYVGQHLTVVGWGKTHAYSHSNIKLKADVPIVDPARCSGLADSQLCAVSRTGEDSCRVDSGGSLMVMEDHGRDSYWYVAGIASFDPSPCNSPGRSRVYTDVSKFGNWISRNIKP